MSKNRKSAVLTIESKEKTIVEHIVKCVLYGDQFDCYDHWVKEISNRLEEVSSLTISTRSSKFKPVEYYDMLFGLIGNEIHDANEAIQFCKSQSNWDKKEYPQVDPTYQQVKYLFEIGRILEDEICPLLAEKRSYSNTYFQRKLHNVLDFYCIA